MGRLIITINIVTYKSRIGMRTSHFLLLDSGDANMTTDNVLLIVMKEWLSWSCLARPYFMQGRYRCALLGALILQAITPLHKIGSDHVRIGMAHCLG